MRCRSPQLPPLSQMACGLDTLASPPPPGRPEPTVVAGTLPWLLLRTAEPQAPHCRLVLVSRPGSVTPFRQKKKKKKKEKKKKTSVLFSPSCFSQRLLVGVVLPLWAHSLLPPQLTHRCACEAASFVGEVGAHAPLPDTPEHALWGPGARMAAPSWVLGLGKLYSVQHPCQEMHPCELGGEDT